MQVEPRSALETRGGNEAGEKREVKEGVVCEVLGEGRRNEVGKEGGKWRE